MQLIKYLQAQGLGSRKLCRSLIDGGRIAVNGNIIEEGKADIDPALVRSLHLDGEPLMVVPLPFFYVLLHKKGGYETSHKPQHHPSVFSLLPDRLRLLGIQAVGRLDEDTTGVLLLTNDGVSYFGVKIPSGKTAAIRSAQSLSLVVCQATQIGTVLGHRIWRQSWAQRHNRHHRN